MRIFLDANILFAAALPKSRTGVFFDEFKKHAILLTNAYAAEEARRNLSHKRPAALPHFEKLMLSIELVAATSTSVEILLAPKDIPILGGAIAGSVTHLLTGDIRDFGAFLGKTIQGVKIVSPQLLMNELAKKGLLKKRS